MAASEPADELILGDRIATPNGQEGFERFHGAVRSPNQASVDVVVNRLPRRVLSKKQLEALQRAVRARAYFISCPQILPLVYFQEEGEQSVLIAGASVSGLSLDDFVKHRDPAAPPLSHRFWVYVAISVAKALEHIHAAKGAPNVHGDICPSNVFLTDAGQVRIANLAFVPGRSQPFRAPEFPHLVPKSDVYSLGLSLTWMLLGGPDPALLRSRVSAERSDGKREKEFAGDDTTAYFTDFVLDKALDRDTSVRSDARTFAAKLTEIVEEHQSWEPGPEVIKFLLARHREVAQLTTASLESSLASYLQSVRREEKLFFESRRLMASEGRAQDAISEVRAELQYRKADLDKASADAKSAQDQRDQLRATLSAQQSDMNILTRRLQTEITRSTSLQEQLLGAQHRLDHAKSEAIGDLATMQRELETERKQSTAAHAKLVQLKGAEAAFQARIAELDAAAQTLQRRVTDAQREASTVATELERTKSREINNQRLWDGQRAQLEADGNAHKQRASRALQTLQELRGSAEAERAKQVDALEQLKTELADRKRELEHLRAEVDRSASERRASDQRAVDARQADHSETSPGSGAAPSSARHRRRSSDSARAGRSGTWPPEDRAEAQRHVSEVVVQLAGYDDTGAISVGSPGSDTFVSVSPPAPALLIAAREALQVKGTGYGSHTDLEALGAELFRILMAAPGARSVYEVHLKRPLAKLLRFLLVFPTDGRPRDMAMRCWPWELAWDRANGRSLALEASFTLRRQLVGAGLVGGAPGADDAGPVRADSLRIFCGISSPADPEVVPLDSEGARRVFEQLCGEDAHNLGGRGGIDVVTMGLTWDNCRQELRKQPDIFHYHGHGEMGRLQFETDTRQLQVVDAAALKRVFAGHPPRIVVLNCCYGTLAEDFLGSVAESLIAAGVPNVVAMQGRLHDDAATDFAKKLYVALVRGIALDEAVQEARLWLKTHRDPAQAFLPVLFQQLPQSPRFDLPRATEVWQRAQEVDAQQVARLPLAYFNWTCARAIEQEFQGELELIEGQERVLNGDLARRAYRDFVARLPEATTSEDELSLIRDAAHTVVRSAVVEEFERRSRIAAVTGKDLIDRLGALQETVVHLADRIQGAPKDDAGVKASRTVLRTLAGAAVVDRSFLRALSPEDVAGISTRICEDLILDPMVVQSALMHLLSGRNLILSGPPGTGKTVLAQRIAQELRFAVHVATATPEWTSFDLVAGFVPVLRDRPDGSQSTGFEVRPGHLVEALMRNWNPGDETWERRAGEKALGVWLVIDEFNRAPMDKAFSDLFTALERRLLRVPLASSEDGAATDEIPIPLDFRIIGTINTFDKDLLFSLSDALKRRFGFVDVDVHQSAGTKPLILKQVRLRIAANLPKGLDGLPDPLDPIWGPLDELYDRLADVVERVRCVYTIGQAQVIDALNFAAVSCRAGWSIADAIDEALIGYFLPQLEGLSAAELRLLAALLTARRLKEAVTATLWPGDFARSRPQAVLATRRVVLRAVRGDQSALHIHDSVEKEGWPNHWRTPDDKVVCDLGNVAFPEALGRDARFVREILKRSDVAI